MNCQIPDPNKETFDFLDNIGETPTIKLFRNSNYSMLPSFSVFKNNNSIVYSSAKLTELVESFLPKNVFSVQHLNNIVTKLPVQTQAAFFKDVLYFGNNVTKEQIAEESFHAIFQRLIDEKTKQQYLAEGKQLIDNLPLAILKYKASYPLLTETLSTKEVEERVIEEAIAKAFVEYLQNNKEPQNKKGILALLSNLFKWIKNLFTRLKTNKDLNLLFGDIAKGNFTKSSVKNTNISEVPTLRLVEYTGKDEDGEDIRRTLNAEESEIMISSIASIVMELDLKLSGAQKEQMDLKHRSKRVDYAIKKLADFYKTKGDERKLSALVEYSTTKYDRKTKTSVTTVSPSLANLKEDVMQYLTQVTGKKAIEEEELDEEIEATLDYGDLIAANEKGFDGLSAWIRNYIGTTGEVLDSFKIEGVAEPINIYKVIDKNKVYYSLARSMQNSSHELERLYKLVNISSLSANKQTKLLVERILKDVFGGTSFEDFHKDVNSLYKTWKEDRDENHYIINNLKNLNKEKQFILQTLLQGFNLWSRENYLVQVEFKNVQAADEEGKQVNVVDATTKAHNANSNSAQETQIQIWENRWNNILNSYDRKDLLEKLTDAKALVTNSYDVESIKEALSILFSDVDDSYVNYLVNPVSDNSIGGTYSDDVTSEDILKILEYAIIDASSEEDGKLYEEVRARIQSLAKNTSKVNENVTEATYKDADGKTRYSYQNKTFQLFMFNEFFTSNGWNEYADRIKKGQVYKYAEGRYLTQASRFLYDGEKSPLNNIVFYNKAWKDAFLEGAFYTVDGLKGSIKKGKDSTDMGAATFGSMQNRDFFLYKLHLIAARTLPSDNGWMQPIHVNIMEAKRTSSFKEVKLIENLFTEDADVTNVAVNLFKKEVAKELKRMFDEQQKVKTWLGMLTPNDKGEISLTRSALVKAARKQGISLSEIDGVIENYHTGVYKTKINEKGEIDIIGVEARNKKTRAFNFTDNVKAIFTEAQFTSIFNDFFVAKQNLNFEDVYKEFEKSYDKQIKENLKTYIVAVSNKLNELKGLLPKEEKNNRYGNLNGFISKGQRANFYNDVLSMWLNTMYVNQLINTDSALLVKNDGADFVKRAGGQNAAIQSLNTTFLSPEIPNAESLKNIKYIVGTDPKTTVSFKTDKTVESADAQSYNTINAVRKYLYSISKLTKESNEILNKIDAGIKISRKDIKYLRENDIYFNVLKPVGYDGYFYFKTGTVMLTKDLTSVYKGGKWVAKIGREALHNLRERMEETGVDYYLGQTASKQLTINKYITPFDNIPSERNEVWDSSINVMDANFFGQQMENPAGKTHIIDPSQMLEIILNEQDETVYTTFNGVSIPIGEMLRDWRKLSINRDNLRFTEAMNEIANADYSLDFNKFLDKAKETIASSGGDDQLIQFFTKDEYGNPQYNLNMSVTLDKFINLLSSHFTKGVLQQKVAGDAQALVSPHGFKALKRIVKYKSKSGFDVYSWEYVPEDSKEYYDNVGKYVKTLTSTDYDEFSQNQALGQYTPLMQELRDMYEIGQEYFVDKLRFGKPVWSVKNGVVEDIPEYFGTEALMPSWEEGVDNTKDMEGMFAVRIPSQDKQSAVNPLWVGKLPEYYGNTVITAEEIQFLSGSDYDIDKLYLHRKEGFKKDGKFIVWKREHNTFENYKNYHLSENKTVKRYVKEAFKEDEFYNKLVKKQRELRDTIQQLRDNFTEYAVGEQTAAIFDRVQEITDELELNPENIIALQDELGILDTQLKWVLADPEEAINYSSARFQFSVKWNLLRNDLEEIDTILHEKTLGLYKSVFKNLGLILTQNEFNEKSQDGEMLILPIINNELLDLKQRLLTNPKMIDRSGREAIALTPATQDNLKDLLKQQHLLNDDGSKYYLFRNEDGSEEFTTSSKYSTHSLLGQDQAHKNVVTGKRNIGVAVVGNLLHIFSKKADLYVKKKIRILDVRNKESGSGELEEFVKDLKSFNQFENSKKQRIADIISELISAATDEAKDQQNAKYNLTIEALNIVIPMLMLGTSLDLALRVINHGDVREYLTMVGKKDNILKTEAERESLANSNENIISDMVNKYTASEKRLFSMRDLKENKKPREVLEFAAKMLAISKEIGLAKYVVSLKKGLGKTLEEFEIGEEKIESTTKLTPNKAHLTNVNNVFSKRAEALSTYTNQIELHKKISKLFNKNVLKRKPFFRDFTDKFKANFNNTSYDVFVKVLNDNIQSYLYSKLYFSKVKQDGNFEQYAKFTKENLKEVEKEWKQFVKDLRSNSLGVAKELNEDLLENPIIRKISYTKKNGSLVVPTFIKEDLATSNPMIDAFLDLHVKLIGTKYEDLTRKLFHYTVHKDGWVFKGGSLFKAMHPLFFTDHSQSLDQAVSDIDKLMNDVPIGLLLYDAVDKLSHTEVGEKMIKRVGKKNRDILANVFKNKILNSSVLADLGGEVKLYLIENGYAEINPISEKLILTPSLYHKFEVEDGEVPLHKLEAVEVRIGDKFYLLDAKNYFNNLHQIDYVYRASYIPSEIGIGENYISQPLDIAELEKDLILETKEFTPTEEYTEYVEDAQDVDYEEAEDEESSLNNEQKLLSSQKLLSPPLPDVESESGTDETC